MNRTLLPLLCAAIALSACVTRPPDVEPQRHLTAAPPFVADDALPPPTPPIFLPKPQPVAKIPSYSVVVRDIPVRELLFNLARDAKINLDLHPAVEGRVTLNAIDQPLLQIMARIARQADLRYSLDGKVLTVLPDDPYLKSYSVDYVNMARTTKSSVSISAAVAAVGGSVGAGGGQTGGVTNASSTQIENVSDNKFWERLTQSLKQLLAASRSSREKLRGQRIKAVAAAEDGQAPASSVSERIEAAKYAAKTGNNALAMLAKIQGEDTKEQALGKEDIVRLGNVASKAGKNAPEMLDTLVAAAQGGSADAVFAHPETGVISVLATHREHEQVAEFLARIGDGARRQVLLEATIVEVQLSDQYQAGIDWSRISSSDGQLNYNQQLIGSNLATAPFSVVSISKSSDSLGSLSMTLRFLERFGKTKVLSSPKLMAINNQTALLKVVDEKVYFALKSTRIEATSTSAARSDFVSEIHTVPIGVMMSVTPQIAEGGLISLNVRPSVTHITGYKADPVIRLLSASSAEKIDSLVPEIQVREIESTLKLASGQTAVLGGLIQDSIETSRSGVPGLSRLPWLGDFFSYRDDKTIKSELVIFMRPLLVQEAGVNGAQAGLRQHLPGSDFFTRPQDELSVFGAGSVVLDRGRP